MHELAEIFDFEGTLWHGERPILEQLAIDFFWAAGFWKKLSLAAVLLELYMIKHYYGRFFPEEFEGKALSAFEAKFLRKSKPSLEFIVSRAREYANDMPAGIVDCIKSRESDLYIISTGTPREILESILGEREVSSCFKNRIFANSFKVHDGQVIGFENEGFFFGRQGKKEMARKIFSSGKFSSASAVGDSCSDLGIMDAAEGAKIPIKMNLIRNGHRKLEYLPENIENVKYIHSIEDYFTSSTP